MEILFSEGLLKVLFATETFSTGMCSWICMHRGMPDIFMNQSLFLWLSGLSCCRLEHARENGRVHQCEKV